MPEDQGIVAREIATKPVKTKLVATRELNIIKGSATVRGTRTTQVVPTSTGMTRKASDRSSSMGGSR